MKLKRYLKSNIQTLNNPPARSMGTKIEHLMKLFKAIPHAFIPKNKIIRGMLIFFLLFPMIRSVYINGSIYPFARDLFNVAIYIFWITFLLTSLMIIGVIFSGSHRKKLIEKYRKNNLISFSEKQYEECAEIMRKFKKIKYKEGVEKYGQDNIDLLIIANGILLYTERIIISQQYLVRMISLKALEQNIEAGEEE
jgi:hypothetical protein